MPQYFSGYDVNKFSNLPKLSKLGGGAPMNPNQEEEALNFWFKRPEIQKYLTIVDKTYFLNNYNLDEKKQTYDLVNNKIREEERNRHFDSWFYQPETQEIMSDDDKDYFLNSSLKEKEKIYQLVNNRIEEARRQFLQTRPPPPFPREYNVGSGMGDRKIGGKKEGGKLSVRDLKNLLNASYDISTPTGDFVEDKKLSTATSKVFVNTKTGQAVVSHRGTEGASDWLNNAAYGLFGEWGYKKTPRYKEAEKVQKNAEKKYGAKKVSTIGHSQGGLQAQILGKNSRETITLNKATRLGSNTAPNSNEYDVRSSGDVVSALNPFRQNTGRDIIIPKTSYNPLSQHSIDILDQLPQDEMIGQGKRKRGGLIGESQLYKGGKYNCLVYSC